MNKCKLNEKYRKNAMIQALFIFTLQAPTKVVSNRINIIVILNILKDLVSELQNKRYVLQFQELLPTMNANLYEKLGIVKQYLTNFLASFFGATVFSFSFETDAALDF